MSGARLSELDRLRVRVRELEDELSEYRRLEAAARTPAGEDWIWELRCAFGVEPGDAKVLDVLMSRAPRIVPHDVLAEAGSPDHAAHRPRNRSVIVRICKLRRGLWAVGLADTVTNDRGVGYAISVAAAAAVRAYVAGRSGDQPVGVGERGVTRRPYGRRNAVPNADGHLHLDVGRMRP